MDQKGPAIQAALTTARGHPRFPGKGRAEESGAVVTNGGRNEQCSGGSVTGVENPAKWFGGGSAGHHTHTTTARGREKSGRGGRSRANGGDVASMASAKLTYAIAPKRRPNGDLEDLYELLAQATSGGRDDR